SNTLFFFSSRRRHTRSKRDWSSDVCSSDLTIIPAGGDFAPEEDLLILLPKGQRAQVFTHPPFTHHLTREIGGALDVVAGTGRDLIKDQFFGDTTAHEDRQAVIQKLFGVAMPVIGRKLHCQTQRTTAWNDCDLVHGR